MENNTKRKTKSGEYWKLYDYWNSKISSHSYPVIIYGPNNRDSKKFFKEIASDNRLSNDCYVLYTDDVVIKPQEWKYAPEDKKISNFLAREYLYLGLLKGFVGDMISYKPDLADTYCQNEPLFKLTFEGIKAAEICDVINEDMDAIVDAYFTSHTTPSIHSVVNNPQEQIETIARKLSGSQNTSFVLDIGTSLELSSMYAINNLLASRNSTRLILPQSCDWRAVDFGDEPQVLRDYTVEYLTGKPGQIQKQSRKKRGKYLIRL